MHRARAFSLLFFAACSIAATSRSVWDGVYTKAQAGRGLARYREDCAKCHAENLMGGEDAPALVGDEFLQKWRGQTAGDLFELIRKTMPSEDPESLSRREYADILAYLLGSNGFPAGEKELGNELAALKEIRIENKR
jgi:S-disulfanyl-L-cysteine oxidoreductase SoxD